MTSPLIVTALFDPESGRVFQTYRERHFPADRNIVPAHLTLFHHLPGDELRRVQSDISGETANHSPLIFRTTGVRFLGHGSAFDIDCVDLSTVRGRLATAWSTWLTRQDQQSFRPHVTVQNKVSANEARNLLEELRHKPALHGRIVGLDLWFYKGGPWEHILHTPFAQPQFTES